MDAYDGPPPVDPDGDTPLADTAAPLESAPVDSASTDAPGVTGERQTVPPARPGRVRVRRMTQDEYDRWQIELADDYAAEQVAVGLWPAEGALQRALTENARDLPDGLDTARMLLLTGVLDDDEPVGRAWVRLDHPRGAPDVAFLYDIEVAPGHRGRGLGRALLAAVEDAVRAAGVPALELNVFARNRAAVGLYSSEGYEIVTQQMRKRL
ncbi:GNAT family N-acetyltransferase [Microbacterium sp. GXF7504]